MVRLSRSISEGALPDGSGILTGFPFPHLFLRMQLGSANPQQISFTGEPFLLRRLGFSPSTCATPGRIFFAERSTPPHGEASALTACLPTSSRRNSEVSAKGLAPSILLTSKTTYQVRLACFQRPEPRRVRYYALLGGWLLLSQPSLCLRFRTTFDTLSLQLGALASVWVLSLSDAKITPAPSLRRICKQIRSLTRLVGISPLDNLISALPRLH